VTPTVLVHPTDTGPATYEVYISLYAVVPVPNVETAESQWLERTLTTVVAEPPRPADPDDGTWTLSHALRSRGASPGGARLGSRFSSRLRIPEPFSLRPGRRVVSRILRRIR
jgi:hypothetical protein